MSEQFDAFMTLYTGLDREGPGDEASLAKAMAGLPAKARIFDAACGSGADTAMMLDILPEAQIIGVDKQPIFIDGAMSRGLNADFRVGDMLEPDGMFDLIWSAGAVYFVGLEAALKAWRGHLNPGGRVAFSEIVWMTGTPSEQTRTFWEAEYPQIGTIDSLSQRIEASGFKVISAEPLGRKGWDSFYDSVQASIKKLRKGTISPVMETVLAESEFERNLFYTHPGDYDYAVFNIEPA